MTDIEKLNDVTFDQFLSLCSRLSPENLCCDGEISKAQVKIRLQRIQSEWAALERKFCVKINEDDVWAEYFKRQMI